MELCIVAVIVAVLAAILLPALARAREAGRRASCQNQLRQFGAIFRMYADEHGGALPHCAPYAHPDDGMPMFLAPHAPAIYPEYLTDLALARCPSDRELTPADRAPGLPVPGATPLPELLADAEAAGDRPAADYFRTAMLARSYTYTGYLTSWAAPLDALAAAPVAGTVAIDGLGSVPLKDFDRDWPAPIRDDERLRELEDMVGMVIAEGDLAPATRLHAHHFPPAPEPDEAAFEGDPPEDVPVTRPAWQPHTQIAVMWDAVRAGPAAAYNHVPGGSNVLYLDGHVEFERAGASPVLTPSLGAGSGRYAVH